MTNEHRLIIELQSRGWTQGQINLILKRATIGKSDDLITFKRIDLIEFIDDFFYEQKNKDVTYERF